MGSISTPTCRKTGNRTASRLKQLAARRIANIAAIALTNKNDPIAWALPAHSRGYDVGYIGARWGLINVNSCLKRP
jgi:hypothetical protein